jgi:ABC-type transport system involved in multi-copper enzyme maturation permease subunit
MKFLAILRDSLRESMDAKVMYALIILSALAVLAAFSISFRAVDAEDGVRSQMQQMPFLIEPVPEPSIRCDIPAHGGFRQLDDKPAWEGKYRFTLNVIDFGSQEEDKDDKAKDKDKPSSTLRKSALKELLTRDRKKLTEEDEHTRERVSIRAQEIDEINREKSRVTRRQLSKQVEELLAREGELLSDQQLERYVGRMVATFGTFDVTEVTLLDKGMNARHERTYTFEVSCVAKEDALKTWPHRIKFLFGAVTVAEKSPIGPFVYIVENYIVGGAGAALAMLLGAVITAFFIPNMLRKGTVDLLISKPISRWSLLLYKYFGGMLFMLIPTAIVVLGIWMAFGLRAGFWGMGFLMFIPILILQFAIFYAISTLTAVLTRSPILCILACCVAWVVLWGTSKLEFLSKPSTKGAEANWVHKSTSTLRKLLPRYKDFDSLGGQLISRDVLGKDSYDKQVFDDLAGDDVHWGESLLVTFLYLTGLVGFSCWLFSIKDY